MTPDVPKDQRRPVSRRAVIGAAVGVTLAAAVGIPTAVSLISQTRGRLVEDLLTGDPFFIAHRGGSADWPEMSGYAYANSVDRGADALEISLARSSDGVWFGLHDETLDRTSGTDGYLAAEHPWASIKRFEISATTTGDPTQPARPYLRFEELIESYAESHTLFVDPKHVAPAFYPELLDIMDAAAENPTNVFIAKYYCTGLEWAAAAKARGYLTWGYYYTQGLEENPGLLAATESYWDILGVDVGGSDEGWATVVDAGKPIIGFIARTQRDADRALARGARGVMVSGIKEVLG